jgi:general secretion pathway protein G
MISEAHNPQSAIRNSQGGFTLVGALTILAVLAIFLTLSVPLWTRVKQRDNEKELIFRGKEYTEAIGRYLAKFGTYPNDLDTLVKLKMIRKLYKDPMTKSGKWKVLHPDSLLQTGAAGQQNKIVTGGGKEEDENDEENVDEDKDKSDEEPEVETTGPVVGVVSRSKKTSMMVYDEQTHYNQWKFVYALAQQQQPQPQPKPQPKPPN